MPPHPAAVAFHLNRTSTAVSRSIAATTSNRLDEFELIARYFAPLAAGFPGAYGLLDDAAVIATLPGHELVVKTDAIVGDVHFLLDDSPDLIARKSLRGLKVLRGKLAHLDTKASNILVDRYRLPRPRVTLGPRLVGLANAALDVSDGLLADLQHICEVSKLAAIVEAHRAPLSTAARAALETNSERITTLLTGGDDYEILFTAPPAALDELTELSQILDVPITAVGRMQSSSIAKQTEITILDGSGKLLTFDRSGWTHFRA
jgi:thiamine-monophosphate kinase